MQRKKAAGTFALVTALPVLFAVPGIAQYPMSVAAGIVVAVIGLQALKDDEPDLDRLKAVSCPAGGTPC